MDPNNDNSPPPSPFTVGETGEPGNLQAYADFTCPRCREHHRFRPRDQDADGGFTCPHCGLVVHIRGTRLSDYQAQLEAVDAQLRDFSGAIADRLRETAASLQADGSLPAASGTLEPSSADAADPAPVGTVPTDSSGDRS